jgi:hypothetical protein
MPRFILPCLIGSGLLTITAAAAAQPHISSSCDGFPVLTARHVAAQYTRMARDRLSELNKLSKDARKTAWNSGHEKKWLGTYSDSRFGVARNVLTGAASVLDSSQTFIECDRSYKNWAATWPEQLLGGPPRIIIKLGKPWLFGMLGLSALQLAGERQQTLVHEAAHHGGANRGEFLGRMGVKDALKRASKYPGIAVRSAENHGYYAICRASVSPACTP